MASVVSKGPGRWQLRAYLGMTANSSPIHKSKTIQCTSKKHAMMLAQQWELELRSTGYVGRGRAVTVAEVADLWLQRLDSENHLEEWTRYGYRTLVDRYIRPHLGPKKIAGVTVRELDEYYMMLRGISESAPEKTHVVLKQLYKEAIRLGLVPTSPLMLVTIPRRRRVKKAWPTIEDVGRMLEAAHRRDPWHCRFLTVAAGTGARRGELAAMRWSDVDQADHIWRIDGAVAALPTRGIFEKGTKTHQSRDVPLHHSIVTAIEEQKQWQEQRAFYSNCRLIRDPWLWSLRHDAADPPLPDNLTKIAWRAAKDAGVQASLHTLRHVFASYLINEGESILTVQQMLGHQSSVTTLNFYAHADRNKMREAVRHFDGLHRRPTPHALGAAPEDRPQHTVPNPPNGLEP